MSDQKDTTAAAATTEQPTEEELEAKRAELRSQLDALTPKPKTLAEQSPEELHVKFFDDLVQHLGSHPHLEATWKELRSRLVKDKPAA